MFQCKENTPHGHCAQAICHQDQSINQSINQEKQINELFGKREKREREKP
jgi:hypothetical protein